MASTAVSRRRSSVGGRRNSHAPLPSKSLDKQKIADKDFQNACIRRILTFLASHGYSAPANERTLQSPSQKDFMSVASFVFRTVDSKFHDQTAEFDNEVCLNLRALGYPFTVSRTTVASSSAPHSWPVLLAALAWVVDHLIAFGTYRDMEAAYKIMTQVLIGENGEEIPPFSSVEELDSLTDRVFLYLIDRGYGAFLVLDSRGADEVLDELQRVMEKSDRFLEREVETINDANAAIVEQICLELGPAQR
jgi:SMC interacting uncharacterized protein involved in chromosome segregation